MSSQQLRASLPILEGAPLAFEVDRGPAFRYTYHAGAQVGVTRWFEMAADAGIN